MRTPPGHHWLYKGFCSSKVLQIPRDQKDEGVFGQHTVSSRVCAGVATGFLFRSLNVTSIYSIRGDGLYCVHCATSVPHCSDVPAPLLGAHVTFLRVPRWRG